MNMHFLRGNFSGFFDLEMCRVGTEAMQIGALWYFFATYQNWTDFAQGFASHTRRKLDRRDFDAALTFAHFLVWRYVTRSGRWRGESVDEADPDEIAREAQGYAASIRLNNSVTFAA